MSAMAGKKTIRIRQIRSGIGCPLEMRETLKALGLGRMQRISERDNTAETRRMIARVAPLVEVNGLLFPVEESTLGRERIMQAVEDAAADHKGGLGHSPRTTSATSSSTARSTTSMCRCLRRSSS